MLSTKIYNMPKINISRFRYIITVGFATLKTFAHISSVRLYIIGIIFIIKPSKAALLL